jgi:flagellar biosynthesis protein FlhG
VVVDTPFPRLRLISGASDVLGAANINYQQKLRVLNKLRSLDVDIVLIDLGAGTSHNIIDFFLISDVSLLAVVPEPTSIENGYRFIKSALYRRLRNAAPNPAVREIIDSALDAKNAQGIRTPLDLLAAVEREDVTAVARLRRELGEFHPRFVVNQVRSPADIAVGHQLVTACARHLGLRASYAGYVHYDDVVWRAVRQRRLFVEKDPDSAPSQEVRQIARGLVEGETLSLAW